MQSPNRSVIFAAAHEKAFIPGIGEIDKTLTLAAVGQKRVTKMTLIDNSYLEVEITVATKKITCAIPITGLKLWQFSDAPTETKTFTTTDKTKPTVAVTAGPNAVASAATVTV